MKKNNNQPYFCENCTKKENCEIIEDAECCQDDISFLMEGSFWKDEFGVVFYCVDYEAKERES